MSFELRSEAFEAGGSIPRTYSCQGQGVSPPLSWRGVPDEAASLALVVDDPDAPSGTFTHWLLYDMPPDLDSLPQGVPGEQRPASYGVQGQNGGGGIGYKGPCPPAGPAHHYHFRLYALDQELGLSPGAAKEEVLSALEGHVVAETELVARYARQG
ncbi:MAG: YbhB/YbcL family Raf kinase inhibitor-like protein [Anaerolineae bacterium]